MNTTVNPLYIPKTEAEINAALLRELVRNAEQTRDYGHTYVKANVREKVIGHDGFVAKLGDREVKLTYEGYGRSLQAGGHKYKAHCRFVDTGKPVPSKDLRSIQAA